MLIPHKLASILAVIFPTRAALLADVVVAWKVNAPALPGVRQVGHGGGVVLAASAGAAEATRMAGAAQAAFLEIVRRPGPAVVRFGSVEEGIAQSLV